MAKKDNKNKKVANKKTKPTVVKKEEPIIEKMELVDQNQEPSQEVLEEILETDGEIVEIKEPEYEPTAEDIDKTIEALNEEPVVEAVEEVKKITKKVDRTFGYLWNGQAIDF